ncbi:hypothetical protein GQ600_24455 [Phytophthora cactorum]|nr:hypothetical protein GQ600_24455 [Phytophthora cactorum]
MRLIYILAVIIAAALRASGTALPTERVGTVDAIATDGGRFLRRVEKNTEHEEKRSGLSLGAWLKKQIPFTASWKEAIKVRKAKDHLAKWRRNRENLKASIMP